MCIFLQIHTDEVEEDSNMLFILDFQIKETYPLCYLFPIWCAAESYKFTNKIPSMPLLCLSLVDCNCSNFPWQENVLIANVKMQGATIGIQNLSLSEDLFPEESSEEGGLG